MDWMEARDLEQEQRDSTEHYRRNKEEIDSKLWQHARDRAQNQRDCEDRAKYSM